MADLILPLKGEYFDAIRDGSKPEEYRLANDYWTRRLVGRTFDRIVLTRGYPKREDESRRLADLLCDWKTPEGKKPTCDAKLCSACTTVPARDKDLCPTHAARWAAMNRKT